MHIAIARFPMVPAARDREFLEWFAWSNEQLRDTAGLKARRLLRAPDGSYTALVEHESAESFAAMHTAEPVAKINERLRQIVQDGPHATKYEVVVDFATSGTCCGDGSGEANQEGATKARKPGGCCQKV